MCDPDGMVCEFMNVKSQLKSSVYDQSDTTHLLTQKYFQTKAVFVQTSNSPVRHFPVENRVCSDFSTYLLLVKTLVLFFSLHMSFKEFKT